MPAQPYTTQVRKCEGPCGRLTRNTKMSKKDFPDTVTRATATLCTSCHRKVLIAEGIVTRSEKVSVQRAALAEERIAAAHLVREQMLRDRAARAKARMVRRVGMGQAMVRI